jgi:hypothetical protein
MRRTPLLRGIPYISKLKKERFDAIGQELKKGNYDIVSLQEVNNAHCMTSATSFTLF